jgi:hypothetical protein
MRRALAVHVRNKRRRRCTAERASVRRGDREQRAHHGGALIMAELCLTRKGLSGA